MIDKELTPRESYILSLVQQGLTNYQIAVTAGVNPVDLSSKYLRSIKHKLGVNSKEEMIALAKEKIDG